MIIAIVIPLTIFAVAIIAYSIFRKRRAATRSAQQTHEVGELDSRPIHEAQEKHLQVTRGELDTGTYHAAELG
jgi:flagellar basal body-associated protein FliL